MIVKPQDDRGETNFTAPLRMHFWSYKCTLYKPKVFLIHLGGNRRWEPLKLGKLDTHGTLAVRLAVKQLQPVVTRSVQGVQQGLLYTDINSTHNACSDDRRHAQNMVNRSLGDHKIR